MITKEGIITIADGEFFLHNFHFKGNNNFEDARKDIMSYIDSILTEENFIPINTVNVSDEYECDEEQPWLG